MAELVYAHDLKSCLVRDVGSTPTPGTQLNNNVRRKFKINYAPLAQLVEQIPLKDKVEGSIPSGRTKHVMLCASRRHDDAEARSRDFSTEKYL